MNDEKSKGSKPDETQEERNGDGVPASSLDIFLLVSALLLIFLVLIVVLFSFWPETDTTLVNQSVRLFGFDVGPVGNEVRLFVLVVVAGALGSFIHVATSAGDYIGNRKLIQSWIYWYILRLPVGASLALLVYLLLRGGVLTGTGISYDPAQTAPFGIVGLSALAGMFAKKATNKLGEVFEMLFRTDQDDKLKDKVGAQAPVLTAIDPSALKVGSTQPKVKIKGQHFDESTKVWVDGEERTAEFVSESQLSLVLKPQDVAQAGVLKVQLENPGSGEKSEILELNIEG